MNQAQNFIDVKDANNGYISSPIKIDAICKYCNKGVDVKQFKSHERKCKFRNHPGPIKRGLKMSETDLKGIIPISMRDPRISPTRRIETKEYIHVEQKENVKKVKAEKQPTGGKKPIVKKPIVKKVIVRTAPDAPKKEIVVEEAKGRRFYFDLVDDAIKNLERVRDHLSRSAPAAPKKDQS